MDGCNDKWTVEMTELRLDSRSGDCVVMTNEGCGTVSRSGMTKGTIHFLQVFKLSPFTIHYSHSFKREVKNDHILKKTRHGLAS